VFKLAAHSRFELVRDHVEVQDPFGHGIVLKIHRYGGKHHQDYLKAQQKGNAVDRAFVQATLEHGLSSGTTGAAALEAVRKRAIEMLKVELDNGLDVFVVMEQLAARQFEEAVDLLAGWSNNPDENGAEIPATPATIRDFLSIDNVVISDEKSYGHGLTLGEANVRFVLEQSGKLDKARLELMEAVEKNSDASVVGS
jgi:hypothetical protein